MLEGGLPSTKRYKPRMISIIFVISNTLVDLIYTWINPTIKFVGGER